MKYIQKHTPLTNRNNPINNNFNQKEKSTISTEKIPFFKDYAFPKGIEFTGTKHSINNQYIRLIRSHGILLPSSLVTVKTKRQAEYMAGRYCAMKSLQAIGQPYIDIIINDDGSPCWPKEFTGSITHCKGLAVAAVASLSVIRFIGIDTEILVNVPRAKKLSQTVLLNKEILLRNAQALRVDWFFTLVFSAKESLYKLVRGEVKRYFGFHSARIIDISIKKQSFTLMLTESLSKEFNEGYLFHGYYQELEKHIITLIYIN